MSTNRQSTLSKLPAQEGLTAPRPVLHLSGNKLRIALERLIGASEPLGGIERFADAVRLKSTVFQERLLDGKAASFCRASFDEIVPLMSTVRRRIGPLLDGRSWEQTHAAILALIDNAHDTTVTDSRIAAFCSTLSGLLSPSPLWGGERGGGLASADVPAVTPPPAPPHRGEGGRISPRFLRDLAAEILHNTYPEHYPMMHRWIWDSKANSGVVRQIWHDPNGGGDDVDHVVIDVADGYETHLVLREELSQFLAENGVFRDMLWHVDLLCAQIYGDYISAQGGAYLKADFVSEGDPLEHTRRILGLDRVAGKRLRTRHFIDGEATQPPDAPPAKLLS